MKIKLYFQMIVSFQMQVCVLQKCYHFDSWKQTKSYNWPRIIMTYLNFNFDAKTNQLFWWFCSQYSEYIGKFK